MVDNTVFGALINPVRGLTEAAQRQMLSKFQPKEYFVVDRDGSLCDLPRLFRPGRIWAVAYAGLMAEQTGNKQDRVDSMAALKVAAHKSGTVFVEASGRRSDKDWPAMRRDGEEMCRRLAQGSKSAINGLRGGSPYSEDYTRETVQKIVTIWYSKRYPNWPARRAAMKRQGVKPLPSRTYCYENVEHLARLHGIDLPE